MGALTGRPFGRAPSSAKISEPQQGRLGDDRRCGFGAALPRWHAILAGMERGSRWVADRSRRRRRGLHPGGVQAGPLVDLRAHGVRCGWRGSWSRRAECSPAVGDERGGRDRHRVDAGPAVVLRCLDRPAARGRGRCGDAVAAAVRRVAADHSRRRAASAPGVSRDPLGGSSTDRSDFWRPPTRHTAWRW